jgi:outer membrane protein assembly factor BamB
MFLGMVLFLSRNFKLNDMNTKVLSLLLVGILSFSLSKSQDHTTWRGSGSSGIYSESGLLKSWPVDGPTILWHFDDLGIGFSSPAFANGKIYLSASENGVGYIYALNQEGKLEWKTTYGEEWTENYPGARSTPSIAGDMLYIFSGKGVITCMSAINGKIYWTKDILKDFNGQNITWGVNETLVIDGNRLFVTPGGVTNNVLALNRLNGQLIWSSKGLGEKPAYCTPLLVKLPTRKLLVTMTENHIIGLDAESGVLLWSHEQTNEYAIHANTPLFYNNGLFCFSGYGQGGVKLVLNNDGSQITKAWFSKKFDSKMGGAVVVDGYIYGSGDKTRDWQCVDWKTGEQKYASQAIGKGNVIFDDGMLYCYSEKGELALVSATPQGFNVVSKTKVGLGSGPHWAHTVIDNGRLFVRHGNSLIAYKIK